MLSGRNYPQMAFSFRKRRQSLVVAIWLWQVGHGRPPLLRKKGQGSWSGSVAPKNQDSGRIKKGVQEASQSVSMSKVLCGDVAESSREPQKRGCLAENDRAIATCLEPCKRRLVDAQR